MRSRILVIASIGMALMVNEGLAAQGVFGNTQIASLFPGDLGRDCIFFTLNGVADAQSASAPGAPWFALAKTHPNFKEQYALILAAKMTGATIGVVTTGNGVSACSGHAEVNYVYAQ